MDNRVFPNQQVQDSPNDQVFKTIYAHAGEQRSKVEHTAIVEPTAKEELTAKVEHTAKVEPMVKVEPTVKLEPTVKVEHTIKRETTKWIIRDITVKASLCNTKSEEKHICNYGKNQEKHESNLATQHKLNDTEPSNYFGEIKFDINHTAKYIQVHSNTTTPKNVLKLMKEKWMLDKPNLLISVFGSMTSFNNTILAKTCQTSLTKAVQGTGTWILTDGKHTYVNTHETTDEQPIIIGISQWKDIPNIHQMDTQPGTSSAEYYPGNNLLDPHHTHFILIDDGSRDTSYTTSKFWEELQSEITKLERDNDVPCVLLVFQSDDNIKKTAENNLKRKLPVLIVKESDTNASSKGGKVEFPKDDPNFKVTHTCEWNVDSCESDLGLAIVKALSKAPKKDGFDKMENMTDQMFLLKLAEAWNMFGIAKNVSIDTKKQTEILQSCMMAAILLDEVEYVRKILDNDFNLNTFLTPERLTNLYEAHAPEELIEQVLEKIKLTDDKKINVLMRVKLLLENLLYELKPKLNKLDNYAMEKTMGTEPDDDSDTWLDLFVWSVLNNRTDMAKLFWRQGKDGMAVALFAHALLIKMAHKTDDKHLKDKCEKVSCEFTTLAIGILKKGYEKGGVNLARKLLIHEQTRWPNTSCVLIAVNAENKQFISDHACQEVFNNIWMRNIKQNTGMLRNNLKLLLCIFLPFLILCLISFKKEKEHTTFNDRKTPIGQKANTGQNSNQENKLLKDTNTDRSKNGLEPTVWDKIKYFYQAPVVICFHNVIAYMIFLALYSYSLMSKVNRYLAWQEILLCVWVFTIFTHEVIQFWSTSSKDIASKFYNYIKDGWNIIDIATVFLFLIGMILRIVDNPEVADSALVVHGVNLITFYLRLLHIFSVHKVLGPKLVMIIHMVKNMAHFFLILVVFIVAYGIVSHAILYPHTEPTFQTITEIVRRPYWNIYGELMLDTIEGSPDCTNDPALYNSGSYSRCPTEAGKYFVPLLLGVYMLMCNILLLNLLIAVFSNTFQKVEDNSYLYWSYQQYSLINEYASRPVLVPPVIIFYYIYKLIVLIANIRNVKPCGDKHTRNNIFCDPRIRCSDEEENIEKSYKNGLIACIDAERNTRKAKID